MPAASYSEVQVTDEERSVLSSARDGYVSAELFRNGDFSEEGFLFFGKLEALCLKGLLTFVDRIGECERRPGDVSMIFALADGARERLQPFAA